jgi:hypothetical protein
VYSRDMVRGNSSEGGGGGRHLPAPLEGFPRGLHDHGGRGVLLAAVRERDVDAHHPLRASPHRRVQCICLCLADARADVSD